MAKAVGTVGKISSVPNASNVIAGQVELIAEWRSVDPVLLAEVAQHFEERVREIAAHRKLHLSFNSLSDTEPIQVPLEVQRLLMQTCAALGLQAQLMPSGAGHNYQSRCRPGSSRNGFPSPAVAGAAIAQRSGRRSRTSHEERSSWERRCWR